MRREYDEKLRKFTLLQLLPHKYVKKRDYKMSSAFLYIFSQACIINHGLLFLFLFFLWTKCWWLSNCAYSIDTKKHKTGIRIFQNIYCRITTWNYLRWRQWFQDFVSQSFKDIYSWVYCSILESHTSTHTWRTLHIIPKEKRVGEFWESLLEFLSVHSTFSKLTLPVLSLSSVLLPLFPFLSFYSLFSGQRWKWTFDTENSWDRERERCRA